jgi:hypothetical protein
MKKGIFCISIDTELLWGRKDLDYAKFIEKTKQERKIIKNLLALFRKYEIPVTWAIVGKLYEKGDKLWSGLDIINWIKKEKIHELGSHSYSHEDFTKISARVAQKEFKNPKGLSFIFPRNHIAHLDLLKKAGFKSYRAKDKSELELLIPRIPPTSNPKINKGLIEIPSSMYFVSNRGTRKYIPYGLRLLKSKFAIDKAINKREIFHLWFHPIDFVDSANTLLKEFEEILKYANKKRTEELLEIKTMGEISKNI